MTRTAKEAFDFAFDALGGESGLAAWAKTKKDEFYKLYARLIPHDVSVNRDDPDELTVAELAELLAGIRQLQQRAALQGPVIETESQNRDPHALRDPVPRR